MDNIQITKKKCSKINHGGMGKVWFNSGKILF